MDKSKSAAFWREYRGSFDPFRVFQECLCDEKVGVGGWGVAFLCIFFVIRTCKIVFVVLLVARHDGGQSNHRRYEQDLSCGLVLVDREAGSDTIYFVDTLLKTPIMFRSLDLFELA